jgi:hypothetical protein
VGRRSEREGITCLLSDSKEIPDDTPSNTIGGVRWKKEFSFQSQRGFFADADGPSSRRSTWSRHRQAVSRIPKNRSAVTASMRS